MRVLEATLRLAHPVIPFITEELWQKVAPLAGKQGETHHARSPIRESQPEKIDPAAENDMVVLKEWTVAARNLRSEAKVPPGEKLPLFTTATPPVADVEAALAAIQSLARLSAVNRTALPESNAPVAVVGEARIMLYKEVDPAVEAERISKEIGRVSAEIAKAKAQLANPSFVERAPPHVVEQIRKRLSDFEENLVKLQDQLQKLRGRK